MALWSRRVGVVICLPILGGLAIQSNLFAADAKSAVSGNAAATTSPVVAAKSTKLAAKKTAAADAQQPASLKAQLAQLLSHAGKSTPQAIEAARAQYDLLRKQTGGDKRVEYAYGLVLVEQHRYAAANQVFAALVKAEPTDAHAWRLKVWAQMLEKSYSGAITDMQQLAKLYPPAGGPDAKDPVNKDDDEFWQDTAFLCGQFCGFLQGPRADVVKQPEVARAVVRIQNSLGTLYWGAFEEGRTDVVQRFEQAQRELELLRTADQLAAVKKQLSAQKRLELEKAALGDRRQSVESRAEALDRLAAEIQQIDSVLGELVESRKMLDDRAALVDAQFLPQSNKTSGMQEPARTDVADYQTRLGQWQQINNQVRQNNTRNNQRNALMVIMNQQASQVTAQILVLQSRRAALLMEGQVESQMLEKRVAALEKADKIAKQSQRKLQRTNSPTASPATRELTAQLGALGSYEAFPVDTERGHVLSLVK